jgi:hypothetical protein
MPNDPELDRIQEYFAHLSVEQFEKNYAVNNPPVPPEARDRPPVRDESGPSQSQMLLSVLEELNEVKRRLARVERQNPWSALPQIEDESAVLAHYGAAKSIASGSSVHNRLQPNKDAPGIRYGQVRAKKETSNRLM